MRAMWMWVSKTNTLLFWSTLPAHQIPGGSRVPSLKSCREAKCVPLPAAASVHFWMQCYHSFKLHTSTGDLFMSLYLLLNRDCSDFYFLLICQINVHKGYRKEIFTETESEESNQHKLWNINSEEMSHFILRWQFILRIFKHEMKILKLECFQGWRWV